MARFREQAGRLLGGACHVALGAALVAQLAVIVCLLLFDAVPVPPPLAKALADSATPEALDARFGGARFRLPDKLILKDISLKRRGETGALFEADALHLRLGLERGSGGAFGIRDATVSGGRLYLPPMHAPSGQRTAVARSVSFSARRLPDAWQVDAFAGIHRDIRVRGALTWSMPPSAAESKPTPVDASAIRNFVATLGRLVRETRALDRLREPALLLDVARAAHGGLNLRASLALRAYASERLDARDLRMTSRFRLRGGRLDRAGRTFVRASKVAFHEWDVALREPEATMPPESLPRFASGEIGPVRLAAQSIAIGGRDLAYPSLRLEASGESGARVSGHATAGEGAFALAGEIDPDRRSGVLRLAGRIDPRRLLARATAGEAPKLTFPRPPNVQATLKFGPGPRFKAADFRLVASGFALGGARFERGSLRGRWSGERLELDAITFARKRTTGRFRGRIDPRTQAFHVTGAIEGIPSDIDALMPPWWKRVFRDYTFGAASKARARVALRGHLDSLENTVYFGAARGSGFHFKGVPMDRARTSFRGGDDYRELRHLKLRHDDRISRGELRVTTRDDKVRRAMSLRYRFTSSAMPGTVARIFEGELSRAITAFDPEQSPAFTVRGAHFDRAYPSLRRAGFADVQASSNGPVRYKGLRFEELDFALHARNEGVFVRDLGFRFADGAGSGALDFPKNTPRSSLARVDLELANVSKDRALRELARSRFAPPGLDRPPENDVPGENETAAKIDIAFQGQGSADDASTFRGRGRFHLRDPRLGSIDVFGPLSRMLRGTPLGFTSFGLNVARGAFILRDETLRFPDMTVTGDRTRMAVEGDYGLEKRSLDFRAAIDLFGNVGDRDAGFRQFARTVNPLPKILEFRLRGTLDDPEWRSVYDPRIWLPEL